MSKKLVIVESPSKSKTIEKYLGNDYKVVSSLGHIRDLTTSGKFGFGVDIENHFKPEYKIIKGKKKLVTELKKDVKNSDFVYLATDPDREGEAISWHLYDTLGLNDANYERIVFNEITKDVILNSFSHARKIDSNLVKSQEYSERLRNLLKQYNNRPEIGGDDNSEIEMTIVGLMAFSQEMIEEEDKANKNHLKGRERAFYDALTTDSKAVQLMTDETLRLIAMKLKDVVEKYATVDWSKKKSTQAEMRSQIKRLLDAYGYPPEYNEDATARVIFQAEYMM